MIKRIAFVLAVVLALAAASYVMWPSPEPEQLAATEQAVAEAETGTEAQPPDQDLDAPGLIDPPVFTRRPRPLGDTGASRFREVVAAQEPFPHDVGMDEYKQELWAEIEADPPQLRERGDPSVDAEMAYRLYMFYGNCSIAPRSGQQVDQRLAHITQRAGNANEATLNRLESTANQILDFYELCLQIPPEVDCRMEAVNWMAEAVRLGHEIAQVQFYEKAMGFILRPDRFSGTPPLVMTQPGLIEEFKATARYALKQGLDKGHPEAFLAMADAIDDGILYPEDPILAFAYLRAAEMQAAGSRIILNRLDHYKSVLAGKLDPAQLADAEELALELRVKASG